MQRLTRAVVLSTPQDSPQLLTGAAGLPLLQPHQLLIRVEFASVCVRDLAVLAGQVGRPQGVLGMEGSGTVVETGSRLKNWRFYHKRVAFLTADTTLPGAWGEFVVVPSRFCFILSDSLTFEQGASLFTLPLTLSLFEEEIAKKAAKAVLATDGASAVGQAVLRLCNFRSIACVSLVDTREEEAMLSGLGAKCVISKREEDFSEKLGRACADLGVTVGFDCLGGALAGEVVNAMKPGGVLYLYEDFCDFQEITGVQPQALIFHKKKIAGLSIFPWFVRKNTVQKLSLMSHIQSHFFLYRSELLGIYEMEEAAAAIDKARSAGRQGKVLLRLRPYVAMRRSEPAAIHREEEAKAAGAVREQQEPDTKAPVELKEEGEERQDAGAKAPAELEEVDVEGNAEDSNVPAVPQLPETKLKPASEDGDEGI